MRIPLLFNSYQGIFYEKNYSVDIPGMSFFGL
jgi:hypothetical protein